MTPSGLEEGATYSLSGAPAGVTLVDGVLSGTIAEAGTYSFKIVAACAKTDTLEKEAATAYADFTITVTAD